MRYIFAPIIICALALTAPPTHTQEPGFPTGYNVTSTYTLSDTVLSSADTLTALRTLTNDESFPLTDLYFSETLPPELAIIEASATINGAPVPVIQHGPLASDIVAGYNTWRWILDSPDHAVSRSISPGEQVQLTYRIAASDIGRFSLPLHTVVAYGNGEGFFATSTEDTIEVLISTDVENDPDPLLPQTLRTLAYPNPFNADVIVSFENAAPGTHDLRFEVFDILGRRIELQLVHPDSRDGIIRWQPGSTIGSGIFLYRLSDTKHTSGGKLLLLK